MKTIIAVLFAAIAIGLGAFNVVQHRQNAKLKADLAQLQERLDDAELQLAERAAADEKIALAERKAKVLQETLKQSSEMAANQSKQVAELEQSLASAQTNSTGLAGILNDPDMREMIKAQQKAILGPMIDRNYSALFKQLNLTPEQTTYIKELLEKRMSIGSELGLSMLDGSTDAEKRKELGQKIKSETDAMNKALEEFLGGENYKTFQSYEKTISDRMQVGQFKDQVAGSENSLNGAQEDQLINLMSQERQDFKWTTDFNSQNPGDVNIVEMFTEDRIKRFSEEQIAYNERVLEKAAGFLSPSQLTALKNHLEAQRKMQEMGMIMAGKMFKPKAK